MMPLAISGVESVVEIVERCPRGLSLAAMAPKTKTVLTEQERKEKQRAAQAAARKQQAAGAPSKKERKKRKREATADGATPATTASATSKAAKATGGGKAWRASEFRGKGRNEHKKERSKFHDDLAAEAEGRRVHDVVIIPIFWRTRPGEEDAVVAEAERIKRLLCKNGGAKKLDVWVDHTHKKSPGQKLAFWETVGVQWRVELGPDDVKRKQCTVSKAGSEGYYNRIAIKEVCTVNRSALYGALRDKLGCEKIPEDIAEDRELDAAHDAEADATLKAWNRLTDAPRLAATRPKAPKLKIDADGKTANTKKITFGDDDDDDAGNDDANDASQFALGDDTDSASDGSDSDA